MDDESKIKYSDIIQPDDAIEKLIEQLAILNQQFGTTTNVLSAGANKIAQALKTMSGATREGRKSIDEAASATAQLEQAQKALDFAMSETGKKVAILKAKLEAYNKQTVAYYSNSKAKQGSYDKLNNELRETIALYKALSEAERTDSFGREVLADILALRTELKAITAEMQPYLQAIRQTALAKQQLAALQKGEFDELIKLKAQIKEEIDERKKQILGIQELTAEERKAQQTKEALAKKSAELSRLRDLGGQRLHSEALALKEVTKEAQLRERVAHAEVGSYNALAAQYDLNVFLLKQMSEEQVKNTESGKQLVSQTFELRNKLAELDSSMGIHTRNVGNYRSAVTGVQQSMMMLLRETPSLAVSFNTFALAISNNIPMLVDSLRRLKTENEAAAAAGNPTKSAFKAIASAVLNWQTALIIGISVLAKYGNNIIEWAKKIIRGRDYVITLKEALGEVNKELEKNAKQYGTDVVKFKKLQFEWKRLKTLAEKKQWIKDNETAFRQLGLGIDSVNTAEKALIDKSNLVVEALILRAKAAAAAKIAEEKYGEAIAKQLELESKYYSYEVDPETKQLVKKAKISEVTQKDLIKKGIYQYVTKTYEDPRYEFAGSYTTIEKKPGVTPEQERQAIAEIIKERTDKVAKAYKKGLEEVNAAFLSAQRPLSLQLDYLASAKDILKEVGVEGYHKKDKGDGKDPIDLTNRIAQAGIRIRKEYEKGVTQLIQQEAAKRKKLAQDEVQNEDNKLKEQFRLNEEYLKNTDGKYKELTAEQRRELEHQQKLIKQAIQNNARSLAESIRKIDEEESLKLNALQRSGLGLGTTGVTSPGLATAGTAVTISRADMEASFKEEYEIRKKALVRKYELIRESNQEIKKENESWAKSEKQIQQEYNQELLKIQAEHDLRMLRYRASLIDAQLKLVREGTDEEIALLKQKYAIAEQIALAQNLLLPPEQRQSSTQVTAESQKATNLALGEKELAKFTDQQALAEFDYYHYKSGRARQRSTRKTEKFEASQEAARLAEELTLADQGKLELTPEEYKLKQKQAKAANKKVEDLSGFKGYIGSVAEQGIGGSILAELGFDSEGIATAEEATNQIISLVQEIAAAEVEAAEKAVEAQEKKVEAAQKAYDAEVEARNNGYANNVATAKKELEEEKKRQQEKQKLLEEAQRKQEAINTVMQTTSLITASAQIWSSMAGVPIVGPALAIAAIAAMWTSFAVSKIKARQATASSEYGEGGLEFLEGGSHASGNDIDLHTRNSQGRNMRAEGGEAMAIINKRNTRKYKKVLPHIVDSLNKGIFEDKYIDAFKSGSNDLLVGAVLGRSAEVDLAGIESRLDDIKKQNDTKVYVLPDGTVILQYKNVKRIIKN